MDSSAVIFLLSSSVFRRRNSSVLLITHSQSSHICEFRFTSLTSCSLGVERNQVVRLEASWKTYAKRNKLTLKDMTLRWIEMMCQDKLRKKIESKCSQMMAYPAELFIWRTRGFTRSWCGIIFWNWNGRRRHLWLLNNHEAAKKRLIPMRFVWQARRIASR